MHTKYSAKWHKKKYGIVPGLFILAVLALVGLVAWQFVPKNTDRYKQEVVPGAFPKNREAAASPQPEPKAQVEERIDQPTSTTENLTSGQAQSMTVVVNKKHKLPNDYVPQLAGTRSGQLRPEAATALESLLIAAEQEGLVVKVISAYRSYERQVAVYDGYVASNGQSQADTFSARPGHSEHQTGLAVDVGTTSCDLLICFGNTAFGEWLKTNSYKYGFIIRYEEGKESVTGYQHEPWHLRYLGIDTASKVHESGITLDEYFGITAGGY